jgi:hypothetical protein
MIFAAVSSGFTDGTGKYSAEPDWGVSAGETKRPQIWSLGPHGGEVGRASLPLWFLISDPCACRNSH